MSALLLLFGSSASASTAQTIRVALVSTMAECPPMAMFPRKERDAETWLESGDYCQDAWTFAQLNRYIVTAGGTVHMWNADSTVQLTSLLVTGPLGWSVVWHAAAVDNEEGPTFNLQVGPKVIANASPWDGYFEVYGIDDPVGPSGGIASARSLEGFYCEASAKDGNIKVEFAYGKPHPGFDHSAYVSEFEKAGPCSSPSLIILPDRQIQLVYVTEDPVDTFTAYRRVSVDDAKTWTDPETVKVGAYMIRNFNDEQSTLRGEVWFEYDSGSSGPGKFVGHTRYGGDADWSVEFTVKDYDTGTPLSVKDIGYDISVIKDGQRSILFSCFIDGESEKSTWVSVDDARSFKRIT